MVKWVLTPPTHLPAAPCILPEAEHLTKERVWPDNVYYKVQNTLKFIKAFSLSISIVKSRKWSYSHFKELRNYVVPGSNSLPLHPRNCLLQEGTPASRMTLRMLIMEHP